MTMAMEDDVPVLASSPRALLAQWAPDSAAIVAPAGASATYGALANAVDSLSERLTDLGLHDGDRIVTTLKSGPLAAAATLSAITLGTCCPTSTSATLPELRRLFARLGPAAVLVDKGVSSAAREVAAETGVAIVELWSPSARVCPASVACDMRVRRGTAEGQASRGLILETSGTTGDGKLVSLPWAVLCSAARATADAYLLTESDRRVTVSPLNHIQGIVGSLLAALVSGGSVVLLPGFEAGQVSRSIDEHSATWFSAGPTQHRQSLASGHARPHRSLRFVRVGNSALSPSLRRQLEDSYQVPVVESYGMTEAHQIASTPLPPAPPRLGLVPAGSQVAICVDGSDRTREPGQRGELVIRGPNVAARYVSAAGPDALQFANGWFHTGDQGEFLADGSFRITGRIKELINRRGHMVSPAEVEDAVLQHPEIADAGAFGVPDPVLGEQLVVAVVLKDGASLSSGAILDFLGTLLSPGKIPDRVISRDSLPLTANGKVSRAVLARVMHDEREEQA